MYYFLTIRKELEKGPEGQRDRFIKILIQKGAQLTLFNKELAFRFNNKKTKDDLLKDYGALLSTVQLDSQQSNQDVDKQSDQDDGQKFIDLCLKTYKKDPAKNLNYLSFALYDYFRIIYQDYQFFSEFALSIIIRIEQITRDYMETSNDNSPLKSAAKKQKLDELDKTIKNYLNLFHVDNNYASTLPKEFDKLGKHQDGKNYGDIRIMLNGYGMLTLSELHSCNEDAEAKYRERTIMHPIYIPKCNIPLDFSDWVVCGDFICAYATAEIKLPKQLTEQGNLTLDLSGYNFPITRIPDGATVVKLANSSVNSFDLLNKIEFPESVNKVVVTNSLFDANNEDAFKTFKTKNPGINIVDEQNHQLAIFFTAEKMKAQQAAANRGKIKPAKSTGPSIPDGAVDNITLFAELEEFLPGDNRQQKKSALRQLMKTLGIFKHTLPNDEYYVSKEDFERLKQTLENSAKQTVSTIAKTEETGKTDTVDVNVTVYMTRGIANKIKNKHPEKYIQTLTNINHNNLWYYGIEEGNPAKFKNEQGETRDIPGTRVHQNILVQKIDTDLRIIWMMTNKNELVAIGTLNHLQPIPTNIQPGCDINGKGIYGDYLTKHNYVTVDILLNEANNSKTVTSHQDTRKRHPHDQGHKTTPPSGIAAALIPPFVDAVVDTLSQACFLGPKDWLKIEDNCSKFLKQSKLDSSVLNDKLIELLQQYDKEQQETHISKEEFLIQEIYKTESYPMVMYLALYWAKQNLHGKR